MGISSVSPESSMETNRNNDVSQLKSQQSTLRSLLEQINSSKDDEKTKQVKVQAIEAKIQKIQHQIQQSQSNK